MDPRVEACVALQQDPATPKETETVRRWYNIAAIAQLDPAVGGTDRIMLAFWVKAMLHGHKEHADEQFALFIPPKLRPCLGRIRGLRSWA